MFIKGYEMNKFYTLSLMVEQEHLNADVGKIKEMKN